MGKNFAVFFERVRQETPVTTQYGLAEALGLNRSAITQAKRLDRIPQKWFLQLSRKFGLSPDWLEFGLGAPRLESSRDMSAVHIPAVQNTAQGMASLPGSVVWDRSAVLAGANRLSGNRQGGRSRGADTLVGSFTPGGTVPVASGMHMVPKVQARLSAGGGSFEVEAQVLDSRAFEHSWLRAMGNPAEMVLMDVVGNSMAPGICDGDTVMVDQGQKEFTFGSIYAVGHGDTVLVKRILRSKDGIALVSDNTDYAPILLQGDELDSFRSIGKVVWLCRTL